jgi:hypothetical protein
LTTWAILGSRVTGLVRTASKVVAPWLIDVKGASSRIGNLRFLHYILLYYLSRKRPEALS